MSEKNRNRSSMIIAIATMITALTGVVVGLHEIGILKEKTSKKVENNSESNLEKDSILTYKIRKKDNPKEKPNISNSDSQPESTDTQTMRSFSINRSILSEKGQPVEGVKVWCTNCVYKEPVWTNKSGYFSLTEKYYVESNVVQKIRICVQYKGFTDCVNQSTAYIEDLNLPKIAIQ